MVYKFRFCRVRDSDIESSDLEKRNRKDKDGESSKNKKKHKKHKKNKKSKKYDGEGKERSKKHKKHQKRSKSSDGYSDSNVESTVAKARGDTVGTSSRHDSDTKLPQQTTSTLNTKFTEIMKSNGHIVVAKAPATKFNNGSNAESSKRVDTTTITTKIPTDPNKLVEFITKSLDPNTSTQVVSSASDSDTVHDVDSPDVAVIEDDLNLEELMRQKALIQARLTGVSDTESENSHKTPLSSAHKPFIENKINEKIKLKRAAEPIADVILLDSSNDASEKPSPPKKKVRSSRSRSRERMRDKDRMSGNSGNSGINRGNRDNRDSRDNRSNTDKSSKSRRSDVENRFKEDLRKEIDRDKERNRSSPKPSQRQQSSSAQTGSYSPSAKSKQTNAPDKSRMQQQQQHQSSFREREV